ncbi:MAG: hypothetical protein ACKOA9_00090, partial [Actinomycetota bacterium]
MKNRVPEVSRGATGPDGPVPLDRFTQPTRLIIERLLLDRSDPGVGVGLLMEVRDRRLTHLYGITSDQALRAREEISERLVTLPPSATSIPMQSFSGPTQRVILLFSAERGGDGGPAPQEVTPEELLSCLRADMTALASVGGVKADRARAEIREVLEAAGVRLPSGPLEAEAAPAPEMRLRSQASRFLLPPTPRRRGDAGPRRERRLDEEGRRLLLDLHRAESALFAAMVNVALAFDVDSPRLIEESSQLRNATGDVRRRADESVEGVRLQEVFRRNPLGGSSEDVKLLERALDELEAALRAAGSRRWPVERTGPPGSNDPGAQILSEHAERIRAWWTSLTPVYNTLVDLVERSSAARNRPTRAAPLGGTLGRERATGWKLLDGLSVGLGELSFVRGALEERLDPTVAVSVSPEFLSAVVRGERDWSRLAEERGVSTERFRADNEQWLRDLEIARRRRDGETLAQIGATQSPPMSRE